MEYKTETGKVITVKKLKLGKYLELIGKLENIADVIAKLQSGSDNMMRDIVTVLSKSEPDIVAILSIGSDVTQETIDELYLYEIAEVIYLIFKENKIDFLLQRVGQTNSMAKAIKTK